MKLLGSLLFLSATVSLHAAATLHPLFTDHAVLQRDVPLPVFGSARPGEKVQVTMGTQKASAVADAEGNWKVELAAAPASSQGRDLEAKGEDGEAARAKDILMGDVWLLGGQSNMRHAFRTYPLLKDSTAQIKDAQMRLLVISDPSTPKPNNGSPSLIHPTYNGSWQEASKPFIDEFTPTGYYFGEELRRELDVPIGLVLSAVGGTPAERWLPPTEAARVKLHAFLSNEPSDLYNAMIAPLRGFAWRGVAWYQGESNSRDPLTYGEIMKALINGWRRELNIANRPFLMVQIAPFEPKADSAIPQASWAWLREQQAIVARSLPKVGLAVTLDVGEAEDIHPQNKQPVGYRLALHALRETNPKLQADSPRFLKQTIEGSHLRISFTQTAGKLESRPLTLNRKRNLPFGTDPEGAIANNDPTGFTICGEDQVFHPATAVIDGNDVLLSCPQVPKPVAARYAWENFPLGNLFGRSGLPAEPFRTDKFPAPDFGLPLEGQAAPSNINGTALQILTTAKETPVGPAQTVDGRDGLKILAATNPEVKYKGRFVYATLPDGAAKESTPRVLSVLYYDNFRSLVKMRYDSSDASVNPNSNRPGAFKEGKAFLMTGKGGWKVVELPIPDGKFERRCNGGDVRLESAADRDLIIGGLYIRPAL